MLIFLFFYHLISCLVSVLFFTKIPAPTTDSSATTIDCLTVALLPMKLLFLTITSPFITADVDIWQ